MSGNEYAAKRRRKSSVSVREMIGIQ